MAEKSADKKKLRDAAWYERLKNSLVTGLAQGPAGLGDLALKGLSLPFEYAVGAPGYDYGSLERGALRKLRESGVLTDQDVTPSTGAQGYLDDIVRYGAMGLTGGGLVRGGLGLVQGGVAGAAKNLPRAFGGPGAKNIAKNVGAYDVAIPGLTAVPGRYMEDISGPGARAITELGFGLGIPTVAGLVRGGKMIPGSQSSNEQWSLRELNRMGIDPTKVRPTGDLNLPTFATGFPELPATASATERAAQATQKGEALRRARESSIGQQNMGVAAQQNPQRVRSMFDTTTTGQGVVPVAERQIQGAEQGVRQTLQQPRNAAGAYNKDEATNKFGAYILDLGSKALDHRRDLYEVFGDTRKFEKLDAKPLRDAMEDVLGTFDSSAMSSGTLSGNMAIQRGGIKDSLTTLLEKNLAATDKSQDVANAAAKDVAKTKWMNEMMVPVPKKVTADTVSPVNLDDKLTVTSLIRMSKDISGLWPTATYSERFLLSKIKAGIDDTLAQNDALAAQVKAASKNNAAYMWMARDSQGNRSPLLSALNSRNPENALQDYMKDIVNGKKSPEDARRLAALADQFGSADELQRLAMDAIEDQASQAAYRANYASPDEVMAASKAARNVIDKSENFRTELGIPEPLAAASSARISESVSRAEPILRDFSAMRDNPSGYFSALLNKSPDEMQAASEVLNRLAQSDPATAAAIRDGLTSAVKRRFTTAEGGFQHGAAATLLGSPEASSLTNFLDPALRERVTKASAAQKQLEAMRVNPADNAISESERNTAAANAAALAAQGFGAPPGTAYRMVRSIEGVNLRPGRVERNDMVGNALTDPNYVQELVGRHANWDVPYRIQAMPSAVQTPLRTTAERGNQFQIDRGPLVADTPTTYTDTWADPEAEDDVTPDVIKKPEFTDTWADPEAPD